MENRREFIRDSALAGLGLTLGISASRAGVLTAKKDEIRLGIIGLDTSHSPAFAKYINDPQKESMKGMKVTTAYPYGSRKIESSYSRIPEYIKEIEAMGIEITDSIDELIRKSDCILLETNDGNLHLEQAIAVFKARKPMFIDKPVAGNLVDVIKIFEAAKKYNSVFFSSSSLRYLAKAQQIRYESLVGDVNGAFAYSPEHLEPSHTELYWYGIHGVEILYTLMGRGCTGINRVQTANADVVTGKWAGDRIGTFRGLIEGNQSYGGVAFGTKGTTDTGPSAGYDALVEKIVEFFRTGKSPIEDAETLEIYTFMEAADESKRRGGAWVELKEVYDKAYDVAIK